MYKFIKNIFKKKLKRKFPRKNVKSIIFENVIYKNVRIANKRLIFLTQSNYNASVQTHKLINHEYFFRPLQRKIRTMKSNTWFELPSYRTFPLRFCLLTTRTKFLLYEQLRK